MKCQVFSTFQVSNSNIKRGAPVRRAAHSWQKSELRLVELRVEAALFEKLLVRALLDDPARVHDEDDVRILNGGEAVRDDEARPALHELGEGVLHQFFRARIDVARRLVENEHGRAADHDARHAQELFLSFGERALAADDGIIPLGQPADEAVRVHRLTGGDHLLFRAVRSAHAQIFADGRVFEPRLLQHHAVIFPKRRARHFAHVLAVHADAAAVHVVKAHQKVDDRRLAAARGTDDGDAVSRRDGDVETADEFLPGTVRKADIRKRDVPLRPAQIGAGFVRGLFLLGVEREDAPRAGEGVLELGEHFRDLVEGLGVLVGVKETARQAPDGKGQRRPRRGDADDRARQGDARVNEGVDEAGDGVGRGGIEHGAQGALSEFLVLRAEHALVLFLVRVRLDDL